MIEQPVSRGPIKIFACRQGQHLAEHLIASLNEGLSIDSSAHHVLGKQTPTDFPGGEFKTHIDENIRGKDVYLIATPLQVKRKVNIIHLESIKQLAHDYHNTLSYEQIVALTQQYEFVDINIHQSLFEALITMHALRKSKPNKLTLIIPFLSYARQDKQRGREPVTAKLLMDIIRAATADGLIVIDPHADQITHGYADSRIDIETLHASSVIIPHLRKKFGNDYFNPARVKTGSPDSGGAERARSYGKRLGLDYVVGDKRRDYTRPGIVETIRIIGQVLDYVVFFVDDMISTGGTAIQVMTRAKKEGAKEVYFVATHSEFCRDAIHLFDEAYTAGNITKVFVTDTVIYEHPDLATKPWIEVISTAPLIAKTIYRVNRNQSVSELLL